MELKYVGTFRLSDDSLDANGERILVKGMDLERFIANPTMFYNHMNSIDGWEKRDKDILPIGRWENIIVQNNELLADAYVDFEDEYSARIGKKIEKGVLNAVSIGFLAKEWSNEEEDKVSGQKGYTITSSELLEASIVDIPSNPNAVAIDQTIEENNISTKNIANQTIKKIVQAEFFNAKTMKKKKTISDLFKKEKKKKIKKDKQTNANILSKKNAKKIKNTQQVQIKAISGTSKFALVKNQNGSGSNSLFDELKAEVDELKTQVEELRAAVDELKEASETHTKEQKSYTKSLTNQNTGLGLQIKELKIEINKMKGLKGSKSILSPDLSPHQEDNNHNERKDKTRSTTTIGKTFLQEHETNKN